MGKWAISPTIVHFSLCSVLQIHHPFSAPDQASAPSLALTQPPAACPPQSLPFFALLHTAFTDQLKNNKRFSTVSEIEKKTSICAIQKLAGWAIVLYSRLKVPLWVQLAYAAIIPAWETETGKMEA